MKVLICGGGIAGLTLAGCLERQGHPVVVVERASHFRDEGYMIDFVGSGYDASERLGLLPELERIHYPISHLTFVDERGRVRVSLPYRLLRRRFFEDRHFNFLRGELARLLYARIEGKVELRFHTTVEALEQHGGRVRVRLSDGTEDDFELLVGADGVHSQIRRLAFGPEERFARFVGCNTAAFILDSPPDRLHDHAAFTTLSVRKRQVAVYPIRGGRLATFFLHRAESPIEDLSRESALRELRTVYGGLDWIVPELLERCTQVSSFYFDTVTQIEMPRWSNGRVVLLGDACQSVSLLAGQGASMAVAGAYILAEELGAAGSDVPAALDRYEQRLKPSIEDKQAAGRRMADWFVPKSRFGLALRDLALRVSLWPGVSSMLRRRMAAESLFRS
ncbi:FAD-dependent monooxygenase [Archangium gephyra]|uniref:FAD-dependent monooxygenase n=1 Tax=Archangium gephyra TaxID=48 RepID=UPI0035D51D8C